MIGLSHTQNHYLSDLKGRGAGWHECRAPGPTADSMEARGVVKVRNADDGLFTRRKMWCVTDPASPETVPEAPLRELLAGHLTRAWRVLGLDKYPYSSGDDAPATLLRVAAAHLRAAADLLDGRKE